MEAANELISSSLPLAWFLLVCAFVVLARCADLFVDSSVSLAHRLKIPKLIIGIVLVSLATTAPELSVSMMSAIRGNPEMALGNAVGSVICDDGLALALAGIVALAPIAIIPRALKTAGVFLITVDILAFVFVAADNTLSRGEGIVLVLLFFGYITFLYIQHKKGKFRKAAEQEEAGKAGTERTLIRIVVLFVAALIGIIVASDFVINCAGTIAEKQLHVPPAVIALTLVAFGTSVPEVATCIAAARKGEGAIAVGNILGADIMNICWVAGASAIANDLVIKNQKDLFFMFPAMLIIVIAMLIMLRIRYRLTRVKGYILLGLYVIYVASFFMLYR